MSDMTEPVSFREEKEVVEKVDRLAKERGTDRSALYREAIRLYLNGRFCPVRVTR